MRGMRKGGRMREKRNRLEGGGEKGEWAKRKKRKRKRERSENRK